MLGSKTFIFFMLGVICIFPFAKSQWSSFGNGINNGGTAAVFSYGFDPQNSNNVFVGGGFFYCGDGQSCLNIGKWNGTNWFPLANGLNGAATSMLFNPKNTKELFVCGTFSPGMLLFYMYQDICIHSNTHEHK
jgi:hypothetical protein